MKKGKVKFTCNFCEGNHPIHLFPLMDETSKELEKLTTSQPHLPARYWKLSPDPSLVDQVIDQKPSLVNPNLSENECHESLLDQPLVDKMVDLAPPSVNCTFLVEIEPHTSQVLLVSLVPNQLERNLLIREVHESSSLVLIEKKGSSHVPMTLPPRSLVTSFDWSRLELYFLLSYVSFQIIV